MSDYVVILLCWLVANVLLVAGAIAWHWWETPALKPRRTHASNGVFRLDGGTEDNDLWVHRTIDEAGEPVLLSVWEPADQEREAIAAGQNIALVVWGEAHPPVTMAVTDIELGKPPPEPEAA